MLQLMFLLLLVAAILAWLGKQRLSLGIFVVMLLSSVFVFVHDITVPLALSL